VRVLQGKRRNREKWGEGYGMSFRETTDWTVFSRAAAERPCRAHSSTTLFSMVEKKKKSACIISPEGTPAEARKRKPTPLGYIGRTIVGTTQKKLIIKRKTNKTTK